MSGPLQPPRMWLVYFWDAGPSWWRPLLWRGFTHVSAVAWYPDQERWVHVAPTYRGMVIEVWRPEEVDVRLGQLEMESTAVLRFAARADRFSMPAAACCVGAVKALLGVRTLAVTPYGLYRALLRAGAVETTPEGVRCRERDEAATLPA